MSSLSLSHQEEWWAHVAAVREGSKPLDVVKRHGYARGHRAKVVAELLRRAAAAPSTTPAGRPTTELSKFAMLNASVCGWADDAPLERWQPQRALREDAARTILIGAVRVARRGALRCMEPECVLDHERKRWKGAKLERGNDSGYCFPHHGRVRRPSEAEEAERALFDALAPLILREEPSRPDARRLRRNGVSLDEPWRLSHLAQR